MTVRSRSLCLQRRGDPLSTFDRVLLGVVMSHVPDTGDEMDDGGVSVR